MRQLKIKDKHIKGCKYYLENIQGYEIIGDHTDGDVPLLVCLDEERNLRFVWLRVYTGALPEGSPSEQERGIFETAAFDLMAEYFEPPIQSMDFDIIDMLMSEDKDRGLIRHHKSALLTTPGI